MNDNDTSKESPCEQATNPSFPPGSAWFDDVNNQFYIWNGQRWVKKSVFLNTDLEPCCPEHLDKSKIKNGLDELESRVKNIKVHRAYNDAMRVLDDE